MGKRGVALVIENDGDMRAALAGVLRLAGFDVHQASSGSEGLARATEHNPDVVTIDIGLPDFDGFEVTRRIRTFSDAYVVIVSGRTEEADAVVGFEAGADDYLTKPFRPQELRARIKAILRRPRSRRENPRELVPPSDRPRVDEVSALPAASANFFDFAHRGLTLREGTRQAAIDGVPVALTRSQFDILLVLMKNGRTIQSKASLARHLRNESYPTGSPVSPREEHAVEVHLSNLRKRLGENPKQPRWVETVHGIGYRMTP